MINVLQKNKKVNRGKSKGAIALFVSIIVFAMFVSLYPLLSSLDNRISYIDNYSDYLLKESDDQKDKEFLMTKLASFSNENLDTVGTEDDVKKYFEVNNIAVIVGQDDGTCIEYNKLGKEFILKLKNSSFLLKPYIENNKVVFICGDKYDSK